MKPFHQMQMEIAGLGFIVYSPACIPTIDPRADFLSTNYWQPEDVSKHVMSGGLVSFCTSSPGSYTLNFFRGLPTTEAQTLPPFRLRLGLRVGDGIAVVRDLYTLMDWEPEYSLEHALALENGYYRLTLLGHPPASGILGDHQTINIHLEPWAGMPPLRHDGVPNFS